MKRKSFKLYVMDNVEKEMQGLQYLSPIPDGGFLFDVRKALISFHSKNVQEPFIIVALDKKGKVLEMTSMHPSEELYSTKGEQYVVEMSEKFFNRLDLESGDVIDFNTAKLS